MGRPTIDDSKKRTGQVNIRLTSAEIQIVKARAETSGLSPANWIRYKIFTGKFPPMKFSPLEVAFYQELRRMGVNLNQIAKQLNQQKSPSDTIQVLSSLQLLLNKILKLLLHDRQHDKR